MEAKQKFWLAEEMGGGGLTTKLRLALYWINMGLGLKGREY